MLRHLVASVAVAGAALFGAATAAQAAPQTPLQRTIDAGWTCPVINGNPHCFDPGDGKSNNVKSVNVKVYTPEGAFLGTEHLWILPVNGKRLCPQDELLTVFGPFGSALACHRYAQ